MTKRPTWYDAEQALHWLMGRETERRILSLLTRLPFADALVLTRLAGLPGETAMYSFLKRLEEAGLVASIRPPLRPGSTPRLFYLTDLGLATLALNQGVKPRDLAGRFHLRGSDLLALVPSLPHLTATYDLLAAIAICCQGIPELVAWERPWRRRYQPPTRKTQISVTLPAFAELSWEHVTAAFLLITDLGTTPLRQYRTILERLLMLRRHHREVLPTLVIAAKGQDRVSFWQELLEETYRAQRETRLVAQVVAWENLHGGLALEHHTWHWRVADGPDFHVPSLPPPSSSGLLPRVVGNGLMRGSTSPSNSLAHLALDLRPAHYALLDLVARHPFLAPDGLAAVLGCSPNRARRQLNALVQKGLMCLVGTEEIGEFAGRELAELSVQGLKLVAARQGLTLATAVRAHGLAGGGPNEPIGGRSKLLRNLAHTLGADAIFVRLYRTARGLASAGSDDEVVAWQNAAACSRRHLRPDGYGVYRRDRQLHGFFLEFDRGTMNRRDYFRKLAAYFQYALSRRFEWDYRGYPTILIVTTSNGAEERIAQAARVAAVGRGVSLPLLLTCQWRIDDPTNLDGLLAHIWRKAEADFDERRCWLPNSNQSCQLNLATRDRGNRRH